MRALRKRHPYDARLDARNWRFCKGPGKKRALEREGKKNTPVISKKKKKGEEVSRVEGSFLQGGKGLSGDVLGHKPTFLRRGGGAKKYEGFKSADRYDSYRNSPNGITTTQWEKGGKREMRKTSGSNEKSIRRVTIVHSGSSVSLWEKGGIKAGIFRTEDRAQKKN